MITEHEIDWAVAVMESRTADSYEQAVAKDIFDEYLQQEMGCCTQNQKNA